jgi:hypothetical protein
MPASVTILSHFAATAFSSSPQFALNASVQRSPFQGTSPKSGVAQEITLAAVTLMTVNFA